MSAGAPDPGLRSRTVPDELPAPDLGDLFAAEAHPLRGGPLVRVVAVTLGALVVGLVVRRWGRRS